MPGIPSGGFAPVRTGLRSEKGLFHAVVCSLVPGRGIGLAGVHPRADDIQNVDLSGRGTLQYKRSSGAVPGVPIAVKALRHKRLRLVPGT